MSLHVPLSSQSKGRVLFATSQLHIQWIVAYYDRGEQHEDAGPLSSEAQKSARYPEPYYELDNSMSCRCRAAVYLTTATFYNIMACRVFRLIRLAGPTNTWASTTGTAMQMSDLRFSGSSRTDEGTATFEIETPSS
ncbi:hypothetical protein QCA50_005900 [Cerrena zonata]|uniref:Uncharacterized protein n=1 Tax=Cerrena zonata TaxID=2478898 RepID=A0AAW0GHV8_9APHY